MQGRLRKNLIGRWEIVNDLDERVEISSGDVIEVYRGERGWVRTRIEHNGRDYVALVGGELSTGMLARESGVPRFSPG